MICEIIIVQKAKMAAARSIDNPCPAHTIFPITVQTYSIVVNLVQPCHPRPTIVFLTLWKKILKKYLNYHNTKNKKIIYQWF